MTTTWKDTPDPKVKSGQEGDRYLFKIDGVVDVLTFTVKQLTDAKFSYNYVKKAGADLVPVLNKLKTAVDTHQPYSE